MQDIYFERREKLREKVRKEQLDGYLVLYAPNRFYLSGFELHDPQCNESAGCLVVSGNGHDWLCTDPRYQQEAQQLWSDDYLFIYKENRLKQLSEFFVKQGLSRLGFETRIMSHEMYSILDEYLELKPYKGLVEDIRIIKDDFEVECLQSSCNLNHETLEFCKNYLCSGLTEMDLAWEIEKCFRHNGASELAFSPIVAFGPHSAFPHHLPKDTALDPENPVLIDIGGRYRNYCSDQTRTVWLGENLPDYFVKTKHLVREAQQKAMNSIRPGVRIKDVFQKTKEFFGQYQVEEYFIHSLGHGIGLETHEYPGLGSGNEDVFKEGMVVTVEPGLYFPEWGGVRWENMVVVREDGVQIL